MGQSKTAVLFRPAAMMSMTVLCLAMIGCARDGLIEKKSQTRSSGMEIFQGMRLFEGSCVADRKDDNSAAASIAALLLEPAVSLAFDTTVAFVKELGEDEEEPHVAIVNVVSKGPETGDAETAFPKCLQLVHGTFFTNSDNLDRYEDVNPDFGTSIVANALPYTDPTEIGGAAKRMRDNAIFLAKTPDLFLELQVVGANTGKAYYLTPTILTYNGLLGTSRIGEGKGWRHLGLTVQISEPGKQGTTGELLPLDLGNVQTGTRHSYDKDVRVSPWRVFPSGEELAPRTVQMTLTESRAGWPFLTKIGTLLEGKKAGITNVVLDELDSDRKKTAKTEAEARKSTETIAFAKNVIAAQAANTAFVAKYSDPVAIPSQEMRTAAIELYEKVLKANADARRLEGQTLPFAEDYPDTLLAIALGTSMARPSTADADADTAGMQ